MALFHNMSGLAGLRIVFALCDEEVAAPPPDFDGGIWECWCGVDELTMLLAGLSVQRDEEK